MRPVPILLFIAATLSWGSLAQAQSEEAKAEAQRRYEEGVALHDKGREEDAYVRFAQAYSVVHGPPILFNLARTEQLTGRLVDAARHFKEYVAHPDHPRITPELREKARAFLAQVEGQLGHITIEAPAGTTITVDGADAAVGTLDVAPGAHTIVAQLGPVSRNVKVSCVAGQTQMANFAFDSPPPPIAPVVSTPPIEASPLQGPAALSPDASGGTHTFWTTKHLTVIGLGVGVVAAAVVGGALFADAGSADSQAKSLTHDQSCAGSSSPACAQASQLKSRYDGDQLGGGIALGIGGALLVSAVVALIAWPEAEASKSAWVAPVAGPNVAGVELGWRF